MEVRNEAGGRDSQENWAEELRVDSQRATITLDKTGPSSDIHKTGHKDILTADSTFYGLSTQKSAFTSPTCTQIQHKGLRFQLLERQLIESISQQVRAELTLQPIAPELDSVTRADYTVEGFQGVRPTPSTDHDYRTDEAITFWSENVDRVQGVTAVRNTRAPFKKNASFTTPISECLDSNPGN